MKSRFCIVIFCFLWISGFSQSFTLSADAKKIIQNSTVTVEYLLDGAKGSGFKNPQFGSLEVVSGPNQSSQMQIINGAVSQSQSFTYTLFATKPGRYTIPAGEIFVNSKKMISNSLTIEVVKGKAVESISEDDKEAYVKLETTSEEAILGQQITIEYKLYTQKNVNGYDLLNESDYDGFFSQELRNYRSEVSREIIDGKEFYTKVIKKLALFPQRTGRFDFSPVAINLSIPIPGAKKRGFFSQVPTRSKRVQTNALSIIVNDPPPNAPVSFSGAVGKYAMSAKINKRDITTDDAFVINMEVRGTGDGKTFSAPDQPQIDNMEYYDPNVVRDEDTSRDGVVSNYKQIEYLIVPKKPGSYIIKPEFTYYDTDSSKYITIFSNAFRVKVRKGTRSITTDNRDVSVTQNLMSDREEVDSLSMFSLKYFDMFWWGSMLLGLVCILGMGFRKSKLVKLENLDPEEKRRRKAIKLANAQLEQARVHKDSNESRKFYEEISRTMNGYLGNKYGLPNTDFQKDKIVSTLANSNVPQGNIDQYVDILKTCEMALFAGQPSSKMGELLEDCTSLILDLEK